jgi:hypothetical protein
MAQNDGHTDPSPGVQSVRPPSMASSANAYDISREEGPTAPRVQRGTNPPKLGPHRDK